MGAPRRRSGGAGAPRIRTGAADLIPTDVGSDHRIAWLTARAEAADTRRHELGAQAALDPPQWALDALGPVPDGEHVVARQDWEHRAGWAVSYRELVGHTDADDPLGAAPGKGRVEHAALFRAALEALYLVDAGAEVANLSDGRLRARVRAYERELAWAPRYVDDELNATHQRHAQASADAELWTARADATGITPEERTRLLADAATAREEAEGLAVQLEQLEVADAARAAWFVHTAVTRDNAERARAELKARGIDPDCPEGRVTAEQWLEAHRVEQADTETHRSIHQEHELHESAPLDDSTYVAQHDEVARAETAVLDLRDTSSVDETETEDPKQRHRIPDVDETAESVARAQESLAEIAARKAADAACAELDEADRAAAEEARRQELASWSAEAADSATGTVADASQDGQEHVLEL
jgi:hypothetical protein